MTGVLKINSGDDSLPTLASSTKAVFATDNTANYDASISLISASNNGDSSIFFGDYANEDAGIIQYKNDNGGSDYMSFTTNTSEAMRINHAGILMIGTTDSTPFNNTSGAGVAIKGEEIQIASENNCLALNHSDGDGDVAKFFRGGTQVGSISVASSSTTYATSSDARLKDVTGSARGLEVINELNPVAYNWKANGKADEGLIAQEVLDVVPNAVSGDFFSGTSINGAEDGIMLEDANNDDELWYVLCLCYQNDYNLILNDGGATDLVDSDAKRDHFRNKFNGQNNDRTDGCNVQRFVAVNIRDTTIDGGTNHQNNKTDGTPGNNVK